MTSSAAMNASLGLMSFDDAPTLEYVVRCAQFSELEDVPDIFAFELNGREAALAALSELAAADGRTDDDDTPTREFVVPHFRPQDFSADQLEALFAMERGDDVIDFDDYPCDPEPIGPMVDLATAIREVLAELKPEAVGIVRGVVPIALNEELTPVWTTKHWIFAASAVLAAEIAAFLFLV